MRIHVPVTRPLTRTANRVFFLILAILFLLPASGASGQTGIDESKPSGLNLGVLKGLGDPLVDPLGGDMREMSLSADYVVQKDSRQGLLRVTAKIADGWHTYSIDQPLPPGPSKIAVKSVSGAVVTGRFVADARPSVRKVEYFPAPLQEHHHNVVWTAPIRLDEGVKPEDVKFDLSFDGQVCSDKKGCVLVRLPKLEVSYLGEVEQIQTPGELANPKSHAVIQGWLEPVQAVSGGVVTLKFHAIIDPNWHIYAFAPKVERVVANPTLFALNLPAGWTASTPVASEQPIEEKVLEDQPPVHYHENEVTWTISLAVPQELAPGDYKLSGMIGYQTCQKNRCDRQVSARFDVTIPVGAVLAEGRIPLVFSELGQNYDQVQNHPSLALWSNGGSTGEGAAPKLDFDKIQSKSSTSQLSWVAILPMALCGGFILNFMPCVLPVIGLKLMSFAQQAGDSRRRVLMLNLWYTLGIVVVFLVLATLAVSVNLGWGQQFSDARFSLVLLSVVYVFSLSLLGVWEIPLPGFVGSGKASELATKEGPVGAFSKGVLTTVLATPCSGPLLVPVVAWAVAKPAYLTYLVFLMLGVGMAIPYLLVGAFPALIAFLPKPGAWMDTFKQAMGFIMLATAVFLLTFIPIPLVVPSVAFMLALGAACWWIGQVSITASLDKKISVWLQGLAFASIVGYGCFTWLYGVMENRFQRQVTEELARRNQALPAHLAQVAPAREEQDELPWQPYSHELLERLSAEGRTVLVDFTADWCLTCKSNEAVALNVAATKQLVEANGVATLRADKTQAAPEADELLARLGNKGTAIPFVAIFPASNPNQPILLDGLFTSPKPVLDALKKAGPSKNTSQAASTAMLPEA